MTEDGQPVTSYQCSEFGLALVEQMGEDIRVQYTSWFISGIDGGPRRIHFDSEEGIFMMETDGGFMKKAK